MKNIEYGRRKYHSSKHPIIHTLSTLSLCLILLLGTILFFASPVQAQPTIFPTPLPSGTIGTLYNTTLMAYGGAPPYTWTIDTGSLPPPLTLTSTGFISGTPTTPGTFNFVVRVTDSLSAFATAPFSITIASKPITFTTTTLPSATEEAPYMATMTVSGGTVPYSWSVSSGTLPTGLTLMGTTGNGIISGTPAKGTAGSSSFIISVTDSSSPPVTAQQSFTLTISKGGWDATVTIDQGLSLGQTKVVVGGNEIATLGGGGSIELSFDLDTSATVIVDSIVPHPTNTGIRFKTETDRITVNEYSPDANFIYHTEFYIDFKTSPANITTMTSSGWYQKGYTLRTSALAEVDAQDKPGTQYRFAYWLLPTGETFKDQNLSLTVNSNGTCVAHYDTYYKLTLTSPYGKPVGGGWYKANSDAEWSLTSQEIRMDGILGVFGGKLKAINYAGFEVMDEPKTVSIDWKPDYTMPAILIPLVLLLIIFGIYGLYRLWQRSQQPKPFPYTPPYQAMPPPPYLYPPPPPQPIPPPQTTVVMIEGDKPKQIPQTTREKLMEIFGELLQKYEEEIGAGKQGAGPQALPEAESIMEKKGLPAPEITPPGVVEADYEHHKEATECGFTTKKLLRTVVDRWKQMDIKPATIPSSDKKGETETPGRAIVWSRGLFNEWEIHVCTLPEGHKGTHKGSMEKVYSLTKTVTEEITYGPKQPLKPPAPHYTDGMPQLEIAANQIVTEDQLPT